MSVFGQLSKYTFDPLQTMRMRCEGLHKISRNTRKDQDPVVQSIVSLKISLRHKFVKQISAKVTNTLLFFVEKM